MKKIGMIGCGNMGEAILSAILSNSIVSNRQVLVSDIDSAKLDRIKGAYKVDVTFNNSIVAKSSECLILAVKPQEMDEALASVMEYLGEKKLLISVAAGVTIQRISSIVGKNIRIARVMPNMPALVRMGFSAIAFSSNMDAKKADFAKKIFRSVGDVEEVEEKALDAVTAVSGSGPAYFYYLIETLISAGIKLGLKPDTARKAVIKTALGSVELLNRTKGSPGDLRRKVTSKGGTTEAALGVFKKMGLARIIEDGVKAARARSRELSGDR